MLTHAQALFLYKLEAETCKIKRLNSKPETKKLKRIWMNFVRLKFVNEIQLYVFNKTV